MSFRIVYSCDALGCIHEETGTLRSMPAGWRALNVTDSRSWHTCPTHTERFAAYHRGERGAEVPELRSR
jgi:hypothetical protein